MVKTRLANFTCSIVFVLLAMLILTTPLLTACDTVLDAFSEGDPYTPPPLIFIPGITGSILESTGTSTVLWPPGGQNANIEYTSLRSQLWRLSLNPQTAPHEALAVPDVIRVYGSDPVYEPFFNFLKEEGGYIEYKTNGIPARRTLAGAITDQKPKPSLFIFPYDWRLPIEENAHILSEYVEVVEKYYPKEKVNIVTHSMGGLVARRYIIDHPGKVNKLITIAAPFLGSAKPLYQMIYGKLSAPAYYGKEAAEAGIRDFLTGGPVADMLAYYPGLHQLMASSGYYELGGPPYSIVETFTEAALQGSLPQTKVLSFTELMGPGGVIDRLFPNPNANGSTPAKTNRDFHAYSANGNNQDDWSRDTTGVKYHHLMGVQSTNDTPLSIREAHGYSAAQVRDYALNVYGPGDGTVPRLSAERIGNGKNYNAPNARLYIYDKGPDALLEHTGIMLNEDVMFQVLQILQDEKPAGKGWVLEETVNSASTETILSKTETKNSIAYVRGLVNLNAGSMYIRNHGQSTDPATGKITYSYDESGTVFFDAPPPKLIPGETITLRVSRGEGKFFRIYFFGMHDPAKSEQYGELMAPAYYLAYKSYEFDKITDGTFSFTVPELYKGTLQVIFCHNGYRNLHVKWNYKASE
jgi:pimeloyl-ACP methyl ester carboxylesterase